MKGKGVSLLVLIYIAVNQDVEAARLTITPSQSLPTGSASLTLRCSPISNAVYKVLYSIAINKRTLVQNSQTTIMAVIDGTGTKPGTGITTPKYTVTGNYDITQQPTQSFLQVVINNPDCSDAVEYQCITSGQPTVASDPPSLQDNKNVTFQSNPGMVEMIRFQEKIWYDVGEKIEITCQGDVGNPEKLWSWESKSVGDSFFNRITENITKGQVDPPSSTRCGYYSRSILNYYVGQGDNRLEIRCKVDNSDQYSANKTIYVTCNPGIVEMIRFQEKIQYSANKTIYVTYVDSCNDENQGPTTDADVDSISPIVSGVIGFICGIMVMVIVGVVYYFYKKRRQLSKPKEDNIPDYVYSNTSLTPTSQQPTSTTYYTDISSNTNYKEDENQSSATNQPATTMVSNSIVQNDQYVNQPYVNQPFNQQNIRNEYETLNHTTDNIGNTYSVLQSR